MKLFFPFVGVVATVVLLQPTASAAHGTHPSHPAISSAVSKAKDQVNKAFLGSRNKMKLVLNSTSPTSRQMAQFFKQAKGQTRMVIRNAQVWEESIKFLEKDTALTMMAGPNVTAPQVNLEKLFQEVGCDVQMPPLRCQEDSPYRTITGECNNRRNATLGAINRALARWLPADYEDGVSLPHGWKPEKKRNGFVLPLAREVSNKIAGYMNENEVLDQQRSVIFMQWGQWLDHELDFAPETEMGSSQYTKDQCDEHCIQEDNCFPIMFPPGDPKLKKQGLCMPFFRSGFVCPIEPTQSLVREQINALTSFVDASMIYGAEVGLATRLRNLTSPLGLLAVNQEFTDDGLPLLPFDSKKPNPCEFINATAGVPCFLAGDSRVSEQILLSVFHTLFLREHNRLARELKRLNPQWDGEKIYQEARKIMGAIVQIISYRDYLPIVLGDELEKMIPKYQGYDEEVDPRVANIFTFAFRFGHTEVPPTVFRLDEYFQPWGPEPELPLHTLFFNTWRLVKDGGVDPLVRGMLTKRSKIMKQNKMMSSELRDQLFQPTHKIHGFDLAAINIQRGRDHGLPDYNAWRRFCGLSQPQNVTELGAVLRNKDLAQKFADLYGTINNIDFWIGAIAEPFVPNGRVGPLLACLLGKQFRQIRDGDRFWWENPGVFTYQQRAALARISFSRLLCDNTRLTKVPRDSFKANNYPQDFVPCTSINKLDLSPWISIRS
ncbi:lactoperoxidase [Ornithorhynchus anatinus]|nr:lactoperoxidase [Ornithorhynchus anatinus]